MSILSNRRLSNVGGSVTDLLKWVKVFNVGDLGWAKITLVCIVFKAKHIIPDLFQYFAMNLNIILILRNHVRFFKYENIPNKPIFPNSCERNT